MFVIYRHFRLTPMYLIYNTVNLTLDAAYLISFCHVCSSLILLACVRICSTPLFVECVLVLWLSVPAISFSMLNAPSKTCCLARCCYRSCESKPHSDCARRRATSRVVAEIEHIDMNGSTQTARDVARRCSAERQKRRSNRDGFDLSVFLTLS
jgi:hypothetical protein